MTKVFQMVIYGGCREICAQYFKKEYNYCKRIKLRRKCDGIAAPVILTYNSRPYTMVK